MAGLATMIVSAGWWADSDNVGGLVGRSQGLITASYGFGGTIGGEAVGSDGSTKPQGVSTAAQLTEANAGSAWNSAANNTLGAWDFGTDEQIPALNYADYDGPGTVFDCSQFPAGACGTRLPRHAEVNATGLSAVVFGATTTITGSFLFGRGLAIESWSWEQLQGHTVTLMGTDTHTATFRAPATGTLLLFELTATDSGGDQYTDRILLFLGARVDHDGDGLIEIDSLAMLHNMRHNLSGTSYKESDNAPGAAYGCPAASCLGYELTRNLDFDVNGDGSTWSRSHEGSYILDVDDRNDDYFPVDSAGAGGWLPIGDGTSPFVAVFDGNGNEISNLAIRRDQTYIGLFGVTGGDAVIRDLGLVYNLADYTGSSTNPNHIGGLVGRSFGSITTSYATGDADGGDGNSDYVGGLVGSQGIGSSITASYATGDVDGGDGDSDSVGGLVGQQDGGSITASYATGDADGGDGDSDRVGGLVGQQDGGSITASYATGEADGGVGSADSVGGLVGSQDNGGVGSADSVSGLVGQPQGLITASYGFGRTIGGEAAGSDGSPKPQGVSTAAQLSAANAGSAWNDTNTMGAWDFGTNEQIPALNYADYDGAGNTFDCSQFPTNACGTSTPILLPGQADVSASGHSAVEHGETVSLVGELLFGRVTIESWSWRQLEGPEVTLSDADARETTFTAPTTNTLLVFELTATDSEGRQYTERISLAVFLMVVDRDGNDLIEIDSLLMLHNMRHNLAGTSYKTSTASVGNSSGCPGALCRGYELTRNLDFDVNGDGSTWSGNAEDGFTLDSEDSQAGYFPVDGDGAGGWLPIGDETNTFAAVFDGNGHTISNLAIRRDQTYIGLFGRMNNVGESVAAIRNLGLIDSLANYTGSGSNSVSIGGEDSDGHGGFVGGLVGLQENGSISASYVVTGAVAGSDGNYDYVGGLVGFQLDGLITASYATGDVDGGDGDYDTVGGLVGQQEGGSITASYAAGAVDGGDDDFDLVGGLVGLQLGSSAITASYATGDATGGVGDDTVGGLVGFQSGSSTITASYATGAAAGGVGDDTVGGLVGFQSGSSTITASYATGAAAGGVGDDTAGGLVGLQDSGSSITASYATGAVDGGVDDDTAGGLVGFQLGSSTITASYATGAAAGGVGDDAVGGLVGSLFGDVSITASYATGAVDGGVGDDTAGGLVGLQDSGSSITASYATGDADGGDGDSDYVGGLVGLQLGSNTITASYATGDADGGDGDSDYVGGLVGLQLGSSTITASYGFGGTIGEESVGSDGSPKPEEVGTAAQLTAANAGSAWNDAGSNTLGAWDFGTDVQIPALNYADYDGVDLVVFDCGQFPANACGTLLPGQRSGPGGVVGGGGGGGSLGLWALVALALAHPLGPRRRRPRHSRA